MKTTVDWVRGVFWSIVYYLEDTPRDELIANIIVMLAMVALILTLAV